MATQLHGQSIKSLVLLLVKILKLKQIRCIFSAQVTEIHLAFPLCLGMFLEDAFLSQDTNSIKTPAILSRVLKTMRFKQVLSITTVILTIFTHTNYIYRKVVNLSPNGAKIQRWPPSSYGIKE